MTTELKQICLNRDIHAAKNMIDFYIKIKSVGTVDLKHGRKIVYNTYKHLFEQEARLPLATGQFTKYPIIL